MTYCEFCGEEIGYLPFKCKYCGGTYCKKHRLPENHECTFELKHSPVVPTTPRESSPLAPPSYRKQRPHRERSYSRSRKKTYKDFGNVLMGMQKTNGTTFIIIAILITSVIGVFLPEFINLSLYGLSNLYIWVIFTSLFSSGTDFFGLLFLFIMIFFLFNISKSIELRFGTRFVLLLYLFCAAFTGLFYVLIRSLLIPIYPISYDYIAFSVGLATGAILGMISFMVFPFPDREMVLLCYFIPVKMKGKVLLLILILFRLIPGLLFGFLYTPLYFAIYLPELGGILGSYLLFKSNFKRRFSSRF